MVVACLLLGASGGVRFWREWQFASLAADNATPSFHLQELPRAMGDWRSEEGSDGQLDPEVARIAGSSDHIVRNYLNEKSGDQISALVIYGLSTLVHGHTPAVCYPAAGYQLVQGPIDREITVPGVEAPVRYRWGIYMKRVGGIGRYEESYHTFLYNGQWMPDASDQWKSFRYHPGMFKIQLSRPVMGLSDEIHQPSEALLGALVREIDTRVSSRRAVEATPAAASPAARSTGPRADPVGSEPSRP
jgi:hypothetical protein